MSVEGMFAEDDDRQQRPDHAAEAEKFLARLQQYGPEVYLSVAAQVHATLAVTDQLAFLAGSIVAAGQVLAAADAAGPGPWSDYSGTTTTVPHEGGPDAAR